MKSKSSAKKNEITRYNPTEIETKWQDRWEKDGIYATPKPGKSKKYILDMYPYPSGATMHVGHLEGYVGTDILSRYYRMKGYDVLHPMGWDSFGLPAENYAIKTGIHPDVSTHKNIETFKRQLNSAGLSYDWRREINSSDPNYYKWNQWLFLLMFKRGLAYKKEADVNWCPSCETVLANEQVVEGKCERCEAEVIQKKLAQWFLKITAYADRLIEGLGGVDWLNEVKVQQKNWIGKKEGINITYKIQDSDLELVCFTTTPVNWAATFIVVAPEHPFVAQLTTKENKSNVTKYIQVAKNKTTKERIAEGREKTGVFTGSYAVNHVTGKPIPVWITDFVIADVGTGAVQGCPGHDMRDFEFAKKYNLPIVRVVVGPDGDESDITRAEQVIEKGAQGTMVNSDILNGMQFGEAMVKTMDYFIEKGWGERVTTLHLRDWLISRQRYWGTPIPMVFCEKCAKAGKGEREEMPGWYSVSDKELPVLLPKDVDFRPTGQSPITRSESFQKGVVCPECGSPARREVDTMDGYVDSSWYFMRFADPHNATEFASQKAIKEWLPVDIYVGGGHVVQHLLFARFFWKVLFDEGLIDTSLGDEPFLKLRAPGWILGPDSRKMSKRWGNVVTPDDIVPKYGADTLRMYEMFMGPFEAMKPWSITGVEGMWRFVNKIWRLFEETHTSEAKNGNNKDALVLVNKLVKKVGEDIDSLSFNTAISSMMETYNSLVELKREGANIDWNQVWEKFLLVLAPFAPYLTEELWQTLGVRQQTFDHGKKVSKVKSLRSDIFSSIHQEKWPEFDPALVEETIFEMPVQVNGKLRATITLTKEEAQVQEVGEEKARALEVVAKHLEGKTIVKVIFVPGRLINFVVST